MTDDDDIWTAEELLWTGGTDAFRNRLAPACLMAFPGIGALEGEAILDSLKDAPRWQTVEMAGRHRVETDGIAVLAYTATGLRDGDAPYTALCTSTWVSTPDGWRLAQHQQAPLPDPAAQ
ncbi:nuclear transport factor 2 family protein [Pseudooceanicola sp. LIPI14-2-Ac024]|uniref:nuclear transport factor 2 family protein n=1 Tax=Pseudooceanicola sp. LIPI14-2-Ac024 TaxID=3344875 RepID=UPI0035CF39EA